MDGAMWKVGKEVGYKATTPTTPPTNRETTPIPRNMPHFLLNQGIFKR